MTTFLQAAGLGIALYRGWELALVMLAVIPLIGVAGTLLAKVMTSGAPSLRSNQIDIP